jgi:hypothetical protein
MFTFLAMLATEIDCEIVWATIVDATCEVAIGRFGGIVVTDVVWGCAAHL